MPDLQRALRRVDEFQQRHRPFAFVFAVVKKFGDDQGGNLCAIITYYGFMSLFPLLLVLVTVLGFVLQGHPGLQHDILNSALTDFPVIGDKIRKNVGSVRGNGVGLAIGIVFTFYGGLGLANAAQDAMNRIWEVPMRARPGFVPRILRSLALVGTIGLGIIVTTVLSGVGGGSANLGGWVRVGVVVVAFVLNVGLFGLAFRVLTARDLAWGDVWPGAVVAAIGWEVLQAVGGAFVSHQLKGMSESVYGVFATVIGLLLWIFLQARVVLYAAEVNVVRSGRLWPRSIAPPPLTDGDKRAYEAYAATEERRPDERVEVDIGEAAKQVHR
ncbi:MAG TPA: YihY/virulence factor BrkB family protein [Acidimicrobiia bacterium]|nr:YihY/virulence factor BrkB family protein [Acidimicrobiia bacterium]